MHFISVDAGNYGESLEHNVYTIRDVFQHDIWLYKTLAGCDFCAMFVLISLGPPTFGVQPIRTLGF